MLENPPPSAADSAPTIKRYAPPNQRNRSLNRRRSGDRIDRTNSYGHDDKNQAAVSRHMPTIDRQDFGTSILNEHAHTRAIPLEGCCRSEASQLLSNRWATVMHCYTDTATDLSERPVMYSGTSESAWRQFRLPHQMMSSTNTTGFSSGSQ